MVHWIYILECLNTDNRKKENGTIYEDNNQMYYVGETNRLYRRFREHIENKGASNTSIYKDKQIVGLYKVNNIFKFIGYDENVEFCASPLWGGPSGWVGYEDERLLDFEVIPKNGEYPTNYDKYSLSGPLCVRDFISEREAALQAENTITECLVINKKNYENIKGGKYTKLHKEYRSEDTENSDTSRAAFSLPMCLCGLPCDIQINKKKNYLFFRCAKKNMWTELKKEFKIEKEPCKFYQEYIKDKELKINNI